MGHVVMNKQYYPSNIIIEKVYTDTKGLEYLEGIYRKYIYITFLISGGYISIVIFIKLVSVCPFCYSLDISSDIHLTKKNKKKYKKPSLGGSHGLGYDKK